MKQRFLSVLPVLVGASGTLLVVFGTGVFLGGLLILGIIKLGDFLSPSSPTFQAMIAWGAVSSVSGFFLIGVSWKLSHLSSTRRFLRHQSQLLLSHQSFEKDEFQKTMLLLQRATSYRTGVCRHCKNWCGDVNGESLLVCAIHPYGWDGSNCPDWEGE